MFGVTLTFVILEIKIRNKTLKIKITLIFLFITSLLHSQITFDANFESGNLNSVTEIESNYFEIRSREDIGGRWFYFRISGVKDQRIKVKISNSDVNRPLYSYDNITFTRFSQSEAPYINYFEKTFTEDTVYVAYYTPYTFTRLKGKIAEWKESHYVFVDTLGYTEMNLPMQEIIITDPFVPVENKIRVWIHARTHPGETPSSFQFEGIVDELLKEDDVIDFYRKNVIFHLIPFTNPDGVYYGRSRTNFNGVDVEREWNKTMDETCLEVQALKRRMNEINSEKLISVFLNLHSQAASYCTFWIHSAYSTSDRFYRMEYQFANLNTSDNPYFTPYDYSESNLRSYFPEGYLWNNYGESVMALTYETPYDQYSSEEWVTDDNLRAIGKRTLYATMEYLGFSHPKRLILDDKDAYITGTWNTDSTGIEFYGSGYKTIQPGIGDNKIVYESVELKQGKYDIFGWWPTDESFAYNTPFTVNAGGSEITFTKTQKTNGGQWNFLVQAELTSAGKIIISLSDDAAGIVAADAFRILYAGLPTRVKNEKLLPDGLELQQNYPNPFNPTTTLSFRMDKSGYAELVVYDILGRVITKLLGGEFPAGFHQIRFNPAQWNLSSGVYIYSLKANGKIISKKMTYLK